MIRRLLVPLLAFWLFASTAWAAPDITGDWVGVWNPDGQTAAPLEMTITRQEARGDDALVEGYFDWACTDPSLECAGRELFRGIVYGDLEFEFDGYDLQDAVNLDLGSYWGTVSAAGITLTGSRGILSDREPLGTLQLSRAVPEPATLALLALGLAALALARKRAAIRR